MEKFSFIFNERRKKKKPYLLVKEPERYTDKASTPKTHHDHSILGGTFKTLRELAQAWERYFQVMGDDQLMINFL